MTPASAGLRVPSVIVVSLWRAWLRHRCHLDQCRYSATASDFDRLPPATRWPTVAPGLRQRQGNHHFQERPPPGAAWCTPTPSSSQILIHAPLLCSLPVPQSAEPILSAASRCIVGVT